jgi:cytochrome c553
MLRHARLALLTLCFTGVVHAAPAMMKADPQQLAFFERKIRPVLVAKCYSCHSEDSKEVKGGLKLDTRDGIRKGGKNGPAVVPENLDDSLLIEAIRWENEDRKMPPKQKLPDEVIADFEKWIEMGAADPREKALKGVKKASDSDAKNYWAFKPPHVNAVNPVDANKWAYSEVDRYILAGLEAKGLSPAPDAERATLIRRVYFDIIGLPPEPETVRAFIDAKDKKAALEKIVDDLLASPQFGERWGRYWLDIARYAESTGKDRNFTFPYAWRYRDYVIASYNADKPYDQFIKEQVAGDLLPSKTPAEHNEHIIATGFLAMGTKSLNEKNKEVFRNDQIDDQIDVTTKAVLALTVACARCHDHKFDPIATKDYYAVAGIFRSTRTFYGTADGGGGAKNRMPSQLIPLNASNAQLAGLKSSLPGYNPKKKGGKKKAAATSPGDKHTPQVGDLAMGVLDDKPVNSPVFIAGEVDNKGPEVPRGFVPVLSSPALPARPSATSSGRLELAGWLTSKANPMTARVAVNRIWQHLLGEGIVKSTDNFGMTGDRPSNQDLLDYLAIKFMANKWSTKAMVRMIVLSHTYQQSSALNPKAFEVDPENTLVWRANERRLDAEALRDAMLAVSGELDLETPHGSAVLVAGDAQVGKGTPPARFTKFEANYRSVYLPIVRDAVPEMLTLFDFAEPSLVVARRDTTNVPAQALFLLNSPFSFAQATAAAKQLLEDKNLTTNKQRIEEAYLTTFSRLPTAAEVQTAQRYLGELVEASSIADGKPVKATELAWTTFMQAMMSSAEFRYLH